MAVAQLSKPTANQITKPIMDETLTDEYLLRLPSNPGSKWEVVDGRLYEVATTGRHGIIVI